MSLDVNQLYVKTCGQEVFFSFKGEVTSERINTVLEQVEAAMVAIRCELRLQKKVYNIMVECLQNLFHHSDIVPASLIPQLGHNFGMLILKRTLSGFDLTVGNFVQKARANFLTEKINKINSLSARELKEMYKFILSYQKLSPKGGGGLGLIDIARKSGHPLIYQFYPYDDEYSFYKLEIVINTN